jgi:hypothetical protein
MYYGHLCSQKVHCGFVTLHTSSARRARGENSEIRLKHMNKDQRHETYWIEYTQYTPEIVS